MANKNLKSIKFPGLSDTYVVPQIDSTLTQTGRPADAKATGDAISALGDSVDEEIDALKEDLSTLNSEGTVPTSEQMLSGNYTEDSVPYHFRKTASDNADREELEIVGGSVAWNQLAVLSEGVVKPNAASRSFDSTTGIYTLVATNITTTNFGFYVTAGTTREGHKILFSAKLNPDSALTNIKMGTGNATSKSITIPASTYTTVSVIANADSYGTLICYSNISQLDLSELTVLVKDIQLFDLTALFGSTIADHIYSLEQATAGAGVALFKSLFPKDYYAYDAGSMQSVSGLSEHKTTGFNQWDEVAEVGSIDATTGQNANATDRIRSKDYIPVLPNTEYYFKAPSSLVICYYDDNKNYIGANDKNGNGDVTSASPIRTTHSNCHYLRFRTYTTYGAAYNHDICINLSDPAKNGTYEPYDGHSYALDDSLTLRGVPTLVDGKIKWDGDKYASDGKVTRRCGVVDLGTLSWQYDSTRGVMVEIGGVAAMAKTDPSNITVICDKYIASENIGTQSDATNKPDKTIFLYHNASASAKRVFVKDSAYTDAATFKTAMSGVYMVYELDTPTIEQADPYIGIQSCDPNGTEEFVSTGIVPVGHNTKYPDNMRAKLDGLPWNFASLIAPTESAFVATRNYTTGALLIVNNVLYKATANIANGGTITPNTNVTATTLAEVIAALS